MDYVSLESEVLELAGTGDFVSAFERLESFERGAAGVERGRYLALVAALRRKLSRANGLNALQLLEESVPYLTPDPEHLLPALVNILALCVDWETRVRGLAWAEKFAVSVAAAAEVGGAAVLLWAARGFAETASLLRSAGDIEAAHRFLERALGILEGLDGSEARGTEVRARLELLQVDTQLGHLLEAELGCRVLLRMNLPPGPWATARIGLGRIAIRTGRLAEAGSLLEEAAEAARAAGGEVAVMWILAMSELERRRGRPGLARGYRRLAVHLAGEGRLDHLLHQLATPEVT